MGCLSAALWLRFALIRKFSVSRDNAPPFNHDFAATGVPGPKAAASGPGAGRTWVQGSRSVGSGLGEPSACSQVHLRSIGQMSAGEKGRGREAAAPEMTGRRERTQGHRSPAGAQRPARLARKGTCTSRSHFGNQRRCSRRASKPSDQPRAWTTLRT